MKLRASYILGKHSTNELSLPRCNILNADTFFYFKILFIITVVCVYAVVCVCECGHVYATVYMWRSGDNF